MKKLLLTLVAVTVVSLTSFADVADILGTYKIRTATGLGLDASYQLTEAVSLFEDNATSYEVVISAVEGEENKVKISNLINWEEEVEGVYDAEAGTITISAGTVVDEDYDLAIFGGYNCTYSGLNCSTMEGTVAYINYYGSYVSSSSMLPVTLHVSAGHLDTQNLAIYYVDDTYSGYAGYIYEVYSPITTKATLACEGTYTIRSFRGVDEDSSYKLTETYSHTSADAETWDVTITATDDDSKVLISNLVDWGETLEGTYDAATDSITIAVGALMGGDGEGYAVYGGNDTTINGNDLNTYEGLCACIDAYSSYVVSSKAKPIYINVADGELNAGPIVVYYPASYSGYLGYAYSVIDFVSTAEPKATDWVVGEYNINYYRIYGLDSSWLLTDEYTSDDEDAEPWTIAVEAVESEQGNVKVTNLLNWEESCIGTYDKEANTITIPKFSTVTYLYEEEGEDPVEYTSEIFGGYSDQSFDEAVADINKNNSYIYETGTEKDVVISLDGNGNIDVSNIFVYDTYYKGYYTGLLGSAESAYNFLYTDKTFTGINNIKNGAVKANDNRVYNMQGILLNSNGSTENLPVGLYIVGGKKVMVK